MKKSMVSNELKTGLLVLAAIGFLGFMLMKVGNFSFLQHGSLIKTQFKFSGGVKKNAPVRLCGVDVGTVKDIRILNGEVVEIDMSVEPGTLVHKDALATVATLGLMGEKYIEIRQGTKAAGDAAPGDIIPSEEPLRLEDLIKMATQIGQDIGQMAKDVSKVANSVDNTIKDNRSKIDRIFDNLDETSENFREFSDDLKWHPWKVLAKGKEVPKPERDKARADRLAARAKELAAKASAA